MDPKDLEFEETLADSELLLKNTARSMDEDAEFTLESILAEYGSGTPAQPEAEEKASEPPVEKKPPAKVVPLPKKAETAKESVDDTADETVRLPVIPFPGAKKAEEPMLYVIMNSMSLNTETWEKKGTYRNGYLLNFVLGIRDSFVKAPDGYSKAAVDKIAGNFKETDSSYSQSDAKNPTIIVIMNESFADLSVVGDFETNTQVTPFMDSLSENTLKGYALSSVYGAKTPNSEWEFETGNSMAFLPDGSETCFGGSSAIFGSCAVRAMRESCETPTPGIMIPPRYCLFRLITESVVAVPISMMISGREYS